MVIETKQRLVDVVVDVRTVHLDEPFTYAAGVDVPPIGSRVRVPLGGRIVSGWVVGMPDTVPSTGIIKPLEEICDDPAIDPAAVELARWMRRRYACTFREALAAVAPRAAAQADRFAFVRPPSGDDPAAVLLYQRFRDKRFTAISASRALRAAKNNTPLPAVRRGLSRMVNEGVLLRSQRAPSEKRRQRGEGFVAVLEDVAAAKGPAQRRLAVTLAAAGGSLPLPEARRRANVSAAVVAGAVSARAIRTHHQESRESSGGGLATVAAMTPTQQQRAAIETLDAAMRAGPVTALLHGITGSGKTFVYSRLIDRARRRAARAIVLVPEIALTPQTAGRFIAAFGSKVGVLHSGLSEAQRASVWADAQAGKLDVVVGARSAVFAPLPDLRLIIVDEEHEASYKQDVAPRYDAAAVAAQRMRAAGGSVVLGSATPSLETYWDALQSRIMHVRLTERATNAPLPGVEVVDMTRQRGLHGKRALGPALTAAIEARLSAGEKTLLFVNRRGYAGLLLCRSCGFAPRCRRCAVSLVVHAADRSMRCHVCGDAFRMSSRCPKCSSGDLLPFGFGTQRLEEEVRELFPEAKVVRMDSDSTGAQGSHERLLRSFGNDGDILIGTQMIAKGLDYPTVTLVGVVAADLDLNRPDFRAAERTFSLLTQVAGRAGRAAPGSGVIVQTYAPDHYAIGLAATHDYDGFASKELDIRRELRYPPFGRISYVIVAGVDQTIVEQAAKALAAHLRSAAQQVDILGPAPDTLPKARGEFRMRIALKSASEQAMLEACELAQRQRLRADVRTTVVVDPR
ncbi:MAG: primosomal protein N' [Candidatus Eremiobacteraeota bacterium]|nr:primosomal protein N' [Candidatus Eremiobacteraeota bacterium]